VVNAIGATKDPALKPINTIVFIAFSFPLGAVSEIVLNAYVPISGEPIPEITLPRHTSHK